MPLPWIRLDTSMPDNPKILRMIDSHGVRGLAAGFVWVCGLAFSGKHGTDGLIEFGFNDGSWGDNPNSPAAIVFGEAPPNDANNASWGGYAGREQFKGIIRGAQIYSSRLTAANCVALGLGLEKNSEVLTTASGLGLTPWYLNMNWKVTDTLDKSGSGNHFSFPASTPQNWRV